MNEHEHCKINNSHSQLTRETKRDCRVPVKAFATTTPTSTTTEKTKTKKSAGELFC